MTTVSANAHTLWSNNASHHSRAVFAAEGIRCAACSKTIEKAVRALPGVEHVNVNVATARVCVDWNPSTIDLNKILTTVSKAGFKPIPLAGKTAESAFKQERRTALKRIGLAGLGMMQVMMYVLGIYVAPPDSIDPAIASYLRYVGMVITIPVLFYSGAPFFQGAYRNIRERSLGMDVPVALALALAFLASVYNTVKGAGETYFDSVTMFIFFLSAGRYMEMVVRQRSLSMSEAVGRSLPAQVSRVRVDGTTERIALSEVVAGDRLSVPKGAVIPVDAELAEGVALVDESLVTGESTPEHKIAGAPLLGGSVNVGSPIRIVARQNVSGSMLASIVGLLERAQAERPSIARLADKVAGKFVFAILALAAITAVVWMFFDPSRAFPASLAVLVVTCPCALSLATPVAVAAASTRIAKTGLLVTRADALERLASIDTVVLDKTGTLTSGAPTVTRTVLFGRGDYSSVLSIAAALERASTHPIAAAFAPHAVATCVADNLQEVEGRGVAGEIDGIRWRLGRHDFVNELVQNTHGAPPADQESRAHERAASDDSLYLGNETGRVAAFELGEDLRPEAASSVSKLNDLGVEVVIASGDRVEAVSRIARSLGITNANARHSPSQKVDLVRDLQSSGRRVLAVGDGINDGPVLAASTVSCAMGQGSAIAQAAADFLLLSDALGAISEGISTARRMLSVMKQNLRWSVAYNLAAVPLAALDLVPPWVAAIGMSASSLGVVLNARRLAGGGARR